MAGCSLAGATDSIVFYDIKNQATFPFLPALWQRMPVHRQEGGPVAGKTAPDTGFKYDARPVFAAPFDNRRVIAHRGV